MSSKPPYSQANSSRKHTTWVKLYENLSVFQNSGDSACLTPKMTHFARTCDVIGHDVMVKPDISNERARAVLYNIKVSWSKLYLIRICSQFISAKYCHFLAKISKRPKISRKRAVDGTLKACFQKIWTFAFSKNPDFHQKSLAWIAFGIDRIY